MFVFCVVVSDYIGHRFVDDVGGGREGGTVQWSDRHHPWIWLVPTRDSCGSRHTLTHTHTHTYNTHIQVHTQTQTHTDTHTNTRVHV